MLCWHGRGVVPLSARPAGRDGFVLACAADARALFLPHFARAGEEQAEIAFLDADRRLIATAGIAGHSCHAVALPIRPILTQALALRTAALIVAHNHPAGDPAPSTADLSASRALATAAATLDIRLLDHLIFAAGECRSFRAAGLL